jgi:hypothetical protein
VVTTLRNHRENGDTIPAFHEVIGDQRCSHSAQLDWAMLERRLGADFELVRRRAYFLSLLNCSVCAKEPRSNAKGNVSIIITPPAYRG